MDADDDIHSSANEKKGIASQVKSWYEYHAATLVTAIVSFF